MKRSSVRVALVHDWLTGMRGGEYMLEAIAEIFANPEIFTLLRVPEAIEGRIARLKCRTAWLQRVPSASRYYRHFLPLMPQMIESFDLTGFDLVVSSSHCVAKGVRKPPGSVHVSYVHAPMRYMWDRFEDYFGRDKASLPVRLAARAVRPYLRRWDRSVTTVERIDRVIANSHFVARRIRSTYGRDATVVYPFADLSRFVRPRAPGNFYLMVGAFAPNKRVDLAVEAFNRMKLPLSIVGRGQDEATLRAMAGPTVKFFGPLSNVEIDVLYSTARAFVFPGVEDFGITPLEAVASGLPVIAYAGGGALETVVEGESGVLFHEPTVEALMSAVERVETGRAVFDEARARARAGFFSKQRFQEGVLREIRTAWREAGKPDSLLEGAILQSISQERARAA